MLDQKRKEKEMSSKDESDFEGNNSEIILGT